MDELQQLEAKLAELQEANRPLREARERREAEAVMRARILAEEIAQRDVPRIEEIEGERDVDFSVVVCRLGYVALRRPKPVQWKRFQDAKGSARDAAEALLRSCLIYPDPGLLTKILDDQPAALDELVTVLAELAGKGVEQLRGKF